MQKDQNQTSKDENCNDRQEKCTMYGQLQLRYQISEFDTWKMKKRLNIALTKTSLSQQIIRV